LETRTLVLVVILIIFAVVGSVAGGIYLYIGHVQKLEAQMEQERLEQQRLLEEQLAREEQERLEEEERLKWTLRENPGIGNEVLGWRVIRDDLFADWRRVRNFEKLAQLLEVVNDYAFAYNRAANREIRFTLRRTNIETGLRTESAAVILRLGDTVRVAGMRDFLAYSYYWEFGNLYESFDNPALQSAESTADIPIHLNRMGASQLLSVINAWGIEPIEITMNEILDFTIETSTRHGSTLRLLLDSEKLTSCVRVTHEPITLGAPNLTLHVGNVLGDVRVEVVFDRNNVITDYSISFEQGDTAFRSAIDKITIHNNWGARNGPTLAGWIRDNAFRLTDAIIPTVEYDPDFVDWRMTGLH
jgi:hypothetical protein